MQEIMITITVRIPLLHEEAKVNRIFPPCIFDIPHEQATAFTQQKEHVYSIRFKGDSHA